jgi:hypothetical protein
MRDEKDSKRVTRAAMLSPFFRSDCHYLISIEVQFYELLGPNGFFFTEKISKPSNSHNFFTEK